MAQKRSKRLQIVLGVIARQEEEAQNALTEVQGRIDAAEQQVQQLQDYQKQYLDDLRGQNGAPKAARQLQSLHAFLNRLGVAIEQQHQQTELLRQELEQKRKIWQEIHQKHKKMAEFIDRCRDEEAALDDKKLQKAMDEAGARKFYQRNDAG